MHTQQIRGILLLGIIIITAAVYKEVTAQPVDPSLQEAQLVYETEKIRLKRENLVRYDSIKFYGVIGLLGAANLSLVILASGYARARVKASSVHTAHIGQHSAIPVHYKDLQSFYPIAVNLSLAEIEASTSASHDTAYRISRQMIEDITNYTRAIAGKRGLLSSAYGQADPLQAALPAQTTAPPFAELVRNGTIAPGKPLLMGFSQGQPQYRELKALKSLAVAGWQGSGKTLSMAYIVASSVVAYGVQAYVIDPHKNHAEGLYSFIQPLEQTGRVKVINPFDTPTLLQNLNQTLDRRLAGQEPNTPGILLVIDELARLAKMDCFDVLVKFLERCTEETRKANITFIGGSHKWTARHFKGRADIRGCMNSMLIHKTKPSQADLLLEDSQDKNLVKQIQRAGEAILVTDFDNPRIVSMPFCTREDMRLVADIIQKAHTQDNSQEFFSFDSGLDSPLSPQDMPRKSSKKANPSANRITTQKTTTSSQISPSEQVIPFDLHRKKRRFFRKSSVDPKKLTLEQIQAQWRKLKQQHPNFTQAELARRSDLSPSHLSKILRGQRPLTPKNKRKLYEALFAHEKSGIPAIKG